MQFAPSSRALSPSEVVIHRLYEITSHYSAGFEQQVSELLSMGLDRFDLDIGILSRIEDGLYIVEGAVAPPGVDLAPGTEFQLGMTYCSVTIDANGPVGFEEAGATSFARHPAYGAFKLESYIGIPVYVGSDLYGTLNFSSAAARERSFEEVDLDSLRLMAGWLSTEIHRRGIAAELAEVRRNLEQLVRTDPLTELLNRRGVGETFERQAERSSFDGAALSCILIDIDDFKEINDRWGHSVGDRVICSVADVIRTSIRPSDVAGRIGGDEFLAVLPGATTSEAQLVAKRIRNGVRDMRVSENDALVDATVSIGVSSVPKDVTSVTHVLTLTEDLLRSSKQSGKDTVSVRRKAG